MQLEFFDVPSPCIGICQSDEKGYCLGCLRSRDERQTWKEFSNDDKQKVIKRCIQRKNRKAKRKEQEHLLVETLPLEPENIDNEAALQPSLLASESKIKTNDCNEMDFGDFEL